MKHDIFTLMVLLCSIPAFTQEKIDTIHLSDNRLQTKWLRPGKHSYLVFFEDSSGRKSRFSLWERNISFEKINRQDIILINQEWMSNDSMGSRKVISHIDRKSFSPVYHHTWSPRAGIQAYQFTQGIVKGVDSVTASTNKYFSISSSEPTLNWELDLETFSLLPYEEGKTFALNFYHPGSKTIPKFYNYKVTGSEKLTLLNGQLEDCWLLSIVYDEARNSKATFYISKKTQDVLKMVEHIGKNKRYKVKMGLAI
jgi:hypothetical protein